LAHGSLHSLRPALPKSSNTRAYLSRPKVAENLERDRKNKTARSETQMMTDFDIALHPVDRKITA
jgi:hypothetical protein